MVRRDHVVLRMRARDRNGVAVEQPLCVLCALIAAGAVRAAGRG